jgi:hypothetical protein
MNIVDRFALFYCLLLAFTGLQCEGVLKAALYTSNTGVVSRSQFDLVLAFASSLHRIGYAVDILRPGTHFTNASAPALHIEDDYAFLKWFNVPLSSSTSDIILPVGRYVIFISIGEGGIPPVFGVGTKLNVYIKEATDDARPVTQIPASEAATLMATYDFFIFGSSQARSTYLNEFESAILTTESLYHLNPTLSVVRPLLLPTTGLITDAKQYGDFVRKKAIALVMSVEDTFSAESAILSIRSMRKFGAVDFYLVNLHDIRIATVRASLDTFLSRLSKHGVEIHVVPKEDGLGDVFAKTAVAWFFNPGENIDDEAPNNTTNDLVETKKGTESDESVLYQLYIEAAARGCLAIVLKGSTLADFVVHGETGWISENARSDFAKYSKALLRIGNDERANMYRAATRVLSPGVATAHGKKIDRLLIRGVLTNTLRHFILKHSDRIRNIRRNVALHSTHVAVIIEPDMNPTFELCVKSVILHLDKKWALKVFHSHSNARYVQQVLRGVSNVQFFEIRGSSNFDIDDYNRLMKNSNFWRGLNAERALIFQSDSVMIRSGIEKFEQYDYVGAPWRLDNNERIQNLINTKQLQTVVGNGGFSLRNVSAMINIVESISSPDDEQEDIFFVKGLEKFGYKIPDKAVAQEFCVEVKLQQGKKLYHKKRPLALHAAWYYVHEDEIKRTLEYIFV